MAGSARDRYARLAGFEMALPALRDRLEDPGTLIAAILPRVAPEPKRINLDRLGWTDERQSSPSSSSSVPVRPSRTHGA
jgi:hypothetical protein